MFLSPSTHTENSHFLLISHSENSLTTSQREKTHLVIASSLESRMLGQFVWSSMWSRCGLSRSGNHWVKNGKFRLSPYSHSIKSWSKDRIHLKEKNVNTEQSLRNLLHSNFYISLAESDISASQPGNREVPNTGKCGFCFLEGAS